MLHGSPATIVLGNGGTKMAGGHPGKEIGDEEQRFLKEWVEKEKTRGMVDMVAFRFGDYTNESVNVNSGITEKTGEGQRGYWFWGNSAKASGSTAMSTSSSLKRNSKGPRLIMAQDGCIFPGTGALETSSVQDISTYISELYRYGDEASARSSGVRKPKKDSMRARELAKPRNPPRAARRNSTESMPSESNSTTEPTGEESKAAATPPPVVGSKLESTARADAAEGSTNFREIITEVTAYESSGSRSSSNTNAKILNLLTFRWSGGSTKSSQTPNDHTESLNPAIRSLPELEPEPLTMVNVDPRAESFDGLDSKMTQPEFDDKIKRARFAIGFLGDLYADDLDDDLEDDNSSGRITSRTVWVERKKKIENEPKITKRSNHEISTITKSDMKLEEFRIVVYMVSHFPGPLLISHKLMNLTTESPTYIRIHIRHLSPTTDLTCFISHSPSSALPPLYSATQIFRVRQRRTRNQRLILPSSLRHLLQSLDTNHSFDCPAHPWTWF